MKPEDVKIGMKVVPHDKTISERGLNSSVVWRNAVSWGQPYLYVTKYNLDYSCWVLGESMNNTGDYFKASDFEPYEEENMDKKLVKIEKLEKELAELRALVEADKKPKKDWPDSFEEAMNISKFWGMEEGSARYMIVTSGPAMRAAVMPLGTWAGFEHMNPFWKGDTGYNCKFVKFDSAKDLYKWMMEGEIK